MPTQKTSREEILVKAIQVFRNKGFYHTSIKDLADACGIQKAHLYYYFKEGKQQIMQEVLETVHLYIEKRVISVAYSQDLTSREKLIALQDKLLRVLTGTEGGCIMANTALECASNATEGPLVEEAQRYYQAIEAALTHIFSEQFPADLASEKANLSLQDIVGGILFMQLYRQASYLERAMARTLERFEDIN